MGFVFNIYNTGGLLLVLKWDIFFLQFLFVNFVFVCFFGFFFQPLPIHFGSFMPATILWHWRSFLTFPLKENFWLT